MSCDKCSYEYEHGHCCYCNDQCNQCSQACGSCMRQMSWGCMPSYVLPDLPPPQPREVIRRSARLAKKKRATKN